VGEEALKALGFTASRAARHREKFRQHDEEGLRKLYEVWGDDHTYGLHIHQHLEDLKTVLENDLEAAEEEQEHNSGAPPAHRDRPGMG